MEINIKTFQLGVFSTNCYAVSCRSGNDLLGFVVDPDKSEPVLQYLKQNNIQLKYIFLTHAHFDHVGGVNQLAAATGAQVICHHADEDLADNPALTMGGYMSDYNCKKVKVDRYANDGDEFEFCGEKIKLMHTPGHTKGSSVYLFDKYIFSGDTLFKLSVGRTDLYDGDYVKLMQSIKKLFDLDFDYQVLPGHGEATSLSFEKYNNPFGGQSIFDI